MKKVVFLHTVPALVRLFDELSRELLPNVEPTHVADEMLLKLVLAQGGLSPFVYQRVADHVIAAERYGASAVQCTCSSISPCVDAAQPLVGIPVLKIDQPMVDEALHLGKRIGIAATAVTTLKPTTDLVYRRAAFHQLEVEVEARLCEGAYAALFSGDVRTHDEIVRRSLLDLMERNDVILLAQASMARAVDTLDPEEKRIPILTSPRLAVKHLKRVLETQAQN
ncbi:MAG: aspartate/glutamate racemase family protein [Anaerolineales bacterium]|nr:aspartate/glutamate racemase family protein [Anaerolineales bacterium]MCS7247909.1 aspartate/glutamate racemase family protein [Anaerolineales bacterium]MDW8161719.1 aspartate/glutamate racemase family protein [Anaerolineales bacterium]MDW8447209.1 aspartate/glutamate racemase family protein [Anaerolineales bacterium]